MRSPGRWRRGRKRAVGRHREGGGRTIFLNKWPHIEDPGNSPEDRKRLMANYNMLSTAKTTITSVSSTLYSTSGIGVTLLLLGFCFAYVRKDNKMSKVGGETSEADKEKSEGTSSAASVSAHVALKLLRPMSYYQFSQALQLFILYGVQLAIFPCAVRS